MSHETPVPLSQFGRRGATSLTWPARTVFWVLAAAAATGGLILLFGPAALEVGGTALVIIGSIFALLGVVGRLPKSMEVSGLALEYEQDEMAEFISTIRGTDLDKATIDQLLDQLQRMSASSRLFKDAKKQASETSTDADDAAENQTETNSAGVAVNPSDTSGTRRSLFWVNEAELHGKVLREYDVVQESGRGRPPRVDFYVNIDDVVVVGEKLSAWNGSTLSLAAQRLHRVFSNDTKVLLAVVTVPSNGEKALREWHQSLDPSLRERVLAGSESNVGLSDVRARLRQLNR